MFELITFSLAMFGAALAVGWLRPASKVWRWQGLAIYPLGAVGAILVFLATERDRSALPLEMKKSDAERAVAALENQRPVVNDGGLWAGSASELFGMIDAIKGLGDSCNRSFGTTASCMVAGKSVDGLTIAQEALRNSEQEADQDQRLIVLCGSFEKVLDKLEKDDALDEDVASQVADKFRIGFSTDRVDDPALHLADDFASEASAKVNDVFSKLGPEYALVREIKVEEVTLGRSLLVGYAACFSAPEAIKTGRLRAWLDQVARQKETSVQTSLELAKIKYDETRAQTAKFVQLSFWPYILIAIFALQFGKTVSELRVRKKAGETPSNTDASTVLSVSQGDIGAQPGTIDPR